MITSPRPMEDLDFDFDALYYRVLGKDDGYIFRAGEPEAIAADPPAHERPYYEFDDLESLGSWLFLGDRVLVLRVPRGARVEENRPMSQGGCMKYSASRIERVGVLSLAELMRTYDAAGVRPRGLHLARQRLGDDLRLPACGADGLNLSHCSGSVDLSGVSWRVCLWKSPIDVLAWPAALTELSVSDGELRGALPALRSLSLSGVSLVDLTVPADARNVELFRCVGRVDLSAIRGQLSLTQCDLEITGLPPRLTALYASDCRIIGAADLPPADERTVRECLFA